MENNSIAEPVGFTKATKEFWDWLWNTDRQSYDLVTMGHLELLELKHKEYEQTQTSNKQEE